MNGTTDTIAGIEPFEDFEIRQHAMKSDPELVCPRCEIAVCDIEHGDSLGTLTRIAADHLAACAPEVRSGTLDDSATSETMCQCEHIEHEGAVGVHRYLGVPAGRRRAQHVGRICDECAHGHLTEYLLSEP